MIQLNLLPDVKMQYIKAQRTRNMVLSTAIIISLASVALLVLLLIVGGLQKKHISDLNADIKSDTATLQKKKDINKILTVQNQLNQLTALHSSKPAASSLFKFLNEVTPTQASINSFKIDFTAQTVTITGSSDSLSSVNKFVDTLKFTKFIADDSAPTPAFNNVVLSNFAVNGGGAGSNKAVSYTIVFNYDPALFDSTKKVELEIPSTTTTRTQPGQTTDLFTEPGVPSTQGGSN